MLVFFYKFIFPWAKANKIQIYINKILGRVVNYIYPVYCTLFPLNKQKINIEKSEIIVSLTSYPARIDKVYLCIESILRQTIQAKKVILWLAKEQFPNQCIPRRLRELEKKGLEIKFCDDLKSYKKIFYTAQKYPENIIVTADDDTLYPENWLENLYKTSVEYPKCVVCYRAHEITFDKNGNLNPYLMWNNLSPDVKGPSRMLVAIGVGGILYPKNFFENVEFNYEIINRLCPSADDLWLKALELIKDVEVVKVNVNSKEWFTIINSQRTKLMNTNIGDNKNDFAFNNLIDFYKISL